MRHPLRPSTSLALAAAVGVCAIAASGAHAAARPRVAVMDLRPVDDGLDALVRAASTALTQGMAKDGGLEVIGAREVEAMLDVAAQQAMLGCQDERCFFNLSDKLAADRIVVGDLGKLDGKIFVFAALLDLKQGLALARASTTSASEGEVPAAMQGLARRLLDPHAPGGDTPLTSVRVAVVFDEYGSDGKVLTRRPAETCVQRAMLARKATLVNASQLKAIRGKSGARDILSGGVPDGVTPEDADALLVGTVDYALNAASGRAGGKLQSYRADATFQLVTVASGEVLASDESSARTPAYTEAQVQQKLGGQVCERITPLIEKALERRIDVGHRVQIVVEGLADAQAAERELELLRKHDGVGRARLVGFQDGKATLDVWLLRGDGVSFGLKLSKRGGLSILEMNADRIRARAGG